MKKLSQENPQARPDLRIERGDEADTRAFPSPEVLVLEASQHPVPHVLRRQRTGEKRGGDSCSLLLNTGQGKRDSQQVPVGSSRYHPFSHLKSSTLKNGDYLYIKLNFFQTHFFI